MSLRCLNLSKTERTRVAGKIASRLVEFESDLQCECERSSTARSGADSARVERNEREGPWVPLRVREVSWGRDRMPSRASVHLGTKSPYADRGTRISL